MNTIPSTKKQRQLIGIACNLLGIDKDTKAAMLFERFGRRSTVDISKSQADEFLKELKAKGFKIGKRHPKKPDFKRAGVGKTALLEKIEAHLADAKRPWAYAHAMAKHMFKIERVQWCSADQLHRIVAALEYDARRHGRHFKS